MDKVIELAKKAGLDSVNGKVYTWAGQHNVTEVMTKFYTLARVDLEHQLEVQGIACMSMSKKMVAMEAENAKLKELLKQTTEELQYGNPRDIATDTYRYDNDLIHAARAAMKEATNGQGN